MVKVGKFIKIIKKLLNVSNNTREAEGLGKIAKDIGRASAEH